MEVIGIIPARYESTRFPGKPLADILGKSMIQRVYNQCKKCNHLTRIIVATDDDRILNHVIEFGGEAMMTSKSHNSGTDRCNEIVEQLNTNFDIIVNIQGDEPYINPKQIEEVIALFQNSTTQIGTLAKKIENHSIILDSNNPKVILDKNTFALNFCRKITDISAETIYYKHIGIYAFTRSVLNKICKLPQSNNEKKEKLEQLRWIDNGYKIKAGITSYESISVDTPEDIIKIKQIMR
ncbi:MAG: 3-deoxy-manno-octulosonate cytidylyltransferase [Flavobacteriales bacterium]|nr:3-deoxy-manno-octulosonate cytidylyltransferase [Flavobacteriales bacterium]|tara:strand:- start:4706 stop:5419 length:714 start_codon:yes stop_codon:yes gene_type:complete